jgi:hypothetical protein
MKKPCDKIDCNSVATVEPVEGEFYCSVHALERSLDLHPKIVKSEERKIIGIKSV